jgi:hypothetical protein
VRPERLARCGSAFDQRLLQAGRSESPVDGAEERAVCALDAATAGRGSSWDGLRDLGLRATIGKATVALALVAVGAAAIHVLGGGKGSPARGEVPAAGLPPTVVTALATEPSRSTPAPTAVELPMLPVDPAKTAEPESPSTPRTPRTASSPPSRLAAPPPIRSRESRSALTVEAALVERAAQALAHGDGEEALRALEEYGARCPQRILGQEADQLRVRALVAVGRSAGESTVR